MKTFKITGSGPLAGQTFYGAVIAAHPSRKFANVELDETTIPCNLRTVPFETEAGFMMNDTGTTDLLFIAKEDLPIFRAQIDRFLHDCLPHS